VCGTTKHKKYKRVEFICPWLDIAWFQDFAFKCNLCRYTLAAMWFRRAATNGVVASQYNFGKLMAGLALFTRGYEL
jgi:TPR repeat protein